MKCLSICVLLFVIIFVPRSANTFQPHIVFILADDLGYNDIGYNAKIFDSDIRTPFLDKLAKNGIRLENYYVQPICSPSRSQLMSGRYSIHTGLQHAVILAGQKKALPLDNKILPEQLKNCGYDTHMVGKWHLGYYKSQYLPQNRGFNSHFGNLNGAIGHFDHMCCRQTICGVDMWNSNGGSANNTFGEYSTHLFTRKAKEAIDRRDKTKPLFLYLSYQAVHYPVEVPEQYMESFKHVKDKTRRQYAGMVAALDESVKKVTKHLKTAGILDDTIIIFSTDNGGDTGYGGNNWPLRGRKATLWEGGVRGVGFVSGRSLGMKNVKSYNFMHISDWLPTILHATGCPKMNDTRPLDGLDQWNSILQKEKSPRTELLHNIDPLHVITSKLKNKIVAGFDITVQAAIRSGPWKLLTGNPGFSQWVKPPEMKHSSLSKLYQTRKNHPLVQLYNIDSDPYELFEISSYFPHIVLSLLRNLANYNKSAVPAYHPMTDPKSNPKLHNGYWVPWADTPTVHGIKWNDWF